MAVKTSLKAYWELNESSDGTGAVTRVDSHGSNDLTDNNTTASATGKVSNGADFELANTEFLSRASNADLQGGNVDFSVVLWFKAESGGISNILFSKDNSVSGEREYVIEIQSDDKVRWEVNVPTDSGVLVRPASFTVVTGTWYFLYASHNAATDVISVSIDDGTVATAAVGGSLQAASAGEFRLGAREFGGSEGFADAVVDEVGWWKKVLATSEVTWLYNSGNGRAYSDLNMNQTAAGSITNTGSLVRSARKIVAGSITNTGFLIRSFLKTVAGSITNTGSLVKRTSKLVAGSITNTGALTTVKAVLQKFYTWTAQFRATDREAPMHAGSDEKRGKA